MSEPLTPIERHHRRLTEFSRWLVAVLDANELIRESIISLARSIDEGKEDRIGIGYSLAMLDELLMDEIEQRFREGNH